MAIQGIDLKYEVTGDVIDILFENPEVFPIVDILQKGTNSKDEALFHLRHSIGISDTYDSINEIAIIHYGDNNLKKRKMAKDMGFFPLPLSRNDIECFWITLEPNEAHKNKKIKVDSDDLDYQPYIESLKGVAKYYETITS